MDTNTQTVRERPNIAANEEQFLAALFTGPTTYDGFIRKVSPKGRNMGVHFRFRAHELCMNGHGVVCYKSKEDNGQTRYRFTNPCEWPYNNRDTEAFFDAVCQPLLRAST